MIIKGVRCPSCGDIIWSRAAHDLRRCSCKKSFVDGGREYLRVGGLAAKNSIKNMVDIKLDDRDARIWRAGDGRYLTHREMSDDHLKNCITHLNNRIEASERDEAAGAAYFEDREELRRTIDEMKEELGHRGIFNILGEVH